MNATMNGSHIRGRAVPELPTFVTSAGYTLHIRKLGPDRLPLIRQAAIRELYDTCPAEPTERVQTGPDEWRDIPNPNQKDYLIAKAAWDDTVATLAGQKVMILLAEYVIADQEDPQAVADYKTLMAKIGIPIPDTETDREVWLWRMVATTQDDIRGLISLATSISIPSQEAIQAQKDSFPDRLPGTIDLETNRAGK